MPVSTKNVNEDYIADIQVPTASGESGAGLIEAAFSETDEQGEIEGPVLSAEQLSREMVTLSVVPKSKWQTLLHLDVIKVNTILSCVRPMLTMVQERNKAKDPPKAPEKAPFFLPSLPDGGTGEDADSKFSAESTAAERSRVARIQHSQDSKVLGSPFTTLLRAGRLSGNFEPFIEHMKVLSPTKIDLEIRSLNPQVKNGQSELSDFVFALASRLQIKKDFELVNVWMAVFLRIHADIVGSDNELGHLRNALADWSRLQEQERERLAGLIGYCHGVVGFLRSSR